MRWPLIITAMLALGTAQGQGPMPKVPEAFSLLKVKEAPESLLAMPSPWNYEHLGLFCKLDVQLERRSKFPVLFRLGDVQQVERWEGKGPLRSY